MMKSSIIPLLLFAVSNALFASPCLAADAAKGRDAVARVASGDWPWWRGPARNGIAADDQQLPLHWSESENVVWKSKVPGRGHASPTVVGNRILLATADEGREIQSVVCYDRADGRQLWNTDVHTGGIERKGHKKSSQASATVASDGEWAFVNFLHDGAIYTTALDLKGRQLWQTKVSDFVTHQGFGSSPAVYGSLVLVSSDNKAGGVVAALDRRNGDIVWRQSRPELPNYTSPTVLKVAGRDQVLVAGCDHISSFDPLTGKPLWDIQGSTTECVGSIVTDGQLVFASGGYPDKLTVAVRGDGSGKVAWQNSVQTYVPSMLVYDGHLYTVTDGGVAICWEAASGKELWKSRLGGTFNASLVLVGDRLLAVNQEGDAFIFRASPKKFELIAQNHLGDDVYATPAVCGGKIYLRVAQRDGDARQEWLYAIGE